MAGEQSAKACRRCGGEKLLSDFNRQATGRAGRASWCRDCARADSRRHYAENRTARLEREKEARSADPDRHRSKRRDQKLKRLYGLTRAQHDEMVSRQDGLCAICAESRPLKVDHCHATGRVRALLCGPCNTALGAFRDQPALLERAARYLREHSA